MKRISTQLFFLAITLLAAAACTPERDLLDANAAAGPGYPVDSRDTYTSNYRPLNDLTLGGPENPDAPLEKTIGNGKLNDDITQVAP